MDTYRKAILALSPVTYWRLGEEFASDGLRDSSGNGRHGTYSGTPALGQESLVRGTKNFSALFSGDDAGLANVAAFSGPSRTVMGWLKTSSAVEDMELFSTGSNQSSLRRLTSQRANFGWRDSGGTGRSLSTATGALPADGLPHFLVGTHDGTTATIYIDGEEVISSASFNAGTLTAANWRIGEFTAGVRRFVGYLDELAVFANALTAEEIETLYRARMKVVGGVHSTTIWTSGKRI